MDIAFSDHDIGQLMFFCVGNAVISKQLSGEFYNVEQKEILRPSTSAAPRSRASRGRKPPLLCGGDADRACAPEKSTVSASAQSTEFMLPPFASTARASGFKSIHYRASMHVDISHRF